MKNKIKLRKVIDPFNHELDVIKYVDFVDGETLLSYQDKYFPEDNFDISYHSYLSDNGHLVPEDEIPYVQVVNESEIIISPKIEDIGTILQIAVFVAAIYIPGAYPALTALEAGLLGGAIMFGGGLITSLITSPATPSIELNNASFSQHNAWNPQTTQQQGVSMPIAYGKNKFFGNIIASHIENTDEGETQTLNALISLGEGPLKNIYDFEINDQPLQIASQFDVVDGSANVIGETITSDIPFEGVRIETRFGVLNQTVIDNFNDTKVEFVPSSVKLSGSGFTYTTTGSTFDGFELDIRFPQGLGYQNPSSGNIDNYTVNIFIEYRKQGDSSWIALVNENVTKNELSNFSKTYTVKNITNKGTYEIRMFNLTSDRSSSNIRYADSAFFVVFREVETSDFEYPREALVSIEAIATDQLSGSFKFSCITDGKLCEVYNGSSWSTDATSSPAWVAWDIATRPVYDNDESIVRYDGMATSRLDLIQFNALRVFNDALVDDGNSGTEPRNRFNGIFDAQLNVWTAIARVLEIGRAAPIWRGRTLTLAIDKTNDTAVQMFSIGSIESDSLEIHYLERNKRSAEIEVDYINEELDYRRDVFSIFNNDITTEATITRKNLFGITRPTEAWRAATILLARNEFLTRIIKIKESTQSIVCKIGDRVEIQHSTPAWGFGGRVISATSTTITLDQTVTIEAATSYGIMVKLDDNTLVEKNITNTPGDYTVLTISGTFSTVPAQYDEYSFGVLTAVTKPFIITDIQPSDDFKAWLTMIEYDVNVYASDTGTPILDEIIHTSLDTNAPVTDLAVTEVSGNLESGNAQRYLNVFFKRPISSLFSRAEIFFRETTSGNWISNGNSKKIFNIYPGTTYEILVVSINIVGSKTTFTDSPSVQFTTGTLPGFGNTALEAKVTGLQIFNQGNNQVFEGRDCKFVWHDIIAVERADAADTELNGAGEVIPATYFKDYKIEIRNSDDQTVRRTEYVNNPEYIYIYEKNFEDGSGVPVRRFILNIWARDIFYRESVAPAKLDVSNPASAVPGNISLAAGINSFIVSFDSVNETDTSRYRIHASQTPGFTPNDSNLVYDGPSSGVSIPATTDAAWYVQMAAVDTFGTDALTYSAELSITPNTIEATDIEDFAVTASKVFNKIPVLEADAWANNDPGGGSVSWNAHNLFYNGVLYEINAGDTSNKYIYWDGTTTYATSNTNPTLTDGQFIIATNISGSHDLAWNAIANEVIGTAYIQNLSVTNAKIDTMTVNKLTAGTITSQVITLAIGTGDVAIKAGKNDFGDTTAGFILGMDDSDSNRAKFEIGNATNYLNWTGVVLSIKGDINVTSGTITGQIISTHEILLNTSGRIRSGQTAYNTGIGFYLGRDSGITKFSIGDPAANSLTWDGSALTINGALTMGAGSIADFDNVTISGTFDVDDLTVSGTLNADGGLLIKGETLDAGLVTLVISTDTGILHAGSWATVSYLRFYNEDSMSEIIAAAELYHTGTGSTISFRLKVGASTYSDVISTLTPTPTYVTHGPTEGVDITALSTGWQILEIQMNTTGSREGALKGLSLVVLS